jgi:hypothetical protein
MVDVGRVARTLSALVTVFVGREVGGLNYETHA